MFNKNKVLCIILAAIMLFGVSAISIGAQVDEENADNYEETTMETSPYPSYDLFTKDQYKVILDYYLKNHENEKGNTFSDVTGKIYHLETHNDGENDWLFFASINWKDRDDNLLKTGKANKYSIHFGTFFTFSIGDSSSISLYLLKNDRDVYTFEEIIKTDETILDAFATKFYAGPHTGLHAYPIFFFLNGDVNLDKDVNVTDATLIQKYIAGIESFRADFRNFYELADLNNDGDINIKDVTALQKHIAGLEY